MGTSQNTPCLKPELCGVQTHRPGTVAACRNGSQDLNRGVSSKLSQTPAPQTSAPGSKNTHNTEDIIAEFQPFDKSTDEDYQSWTPEQRQLSDKVEARVLEKYKITMMLDDNLDYVLVHEDGRYMTGSIGYGGMDTALWDDFGGRRTTDDLNDPEVLDRELEIEFARFERLWRQYEAETA